MAKKKSEEQKPLRTPIVAVLGHVDHGKCLTPESEVVCSIGVATLKDLFDSARCVVYKENGCEIRKVDLDVEGLNGDAKESKLKASHVWRLKHSGKLLKIRLKNWHHITVTPEHPFLTNLGWKKALACQSKL